MRKENRSISLSRAEPTPLSPADGVTVVQHFTGERLVHHADATRLFHSFPTTLTHPTAPSSAPASPGASGLVPLVTHAPAPPRVPEHALVSVEHAGAVRVLIYLAPDYEAGAAAARASVDGATAATEETVVGTEADALGWAADGRPFLWRRERVVVLAPDGTAAEWRAGGPDKPTVVLEKVRCPLTSLVLFSLRLHRVSCRS